MGGAAGKTVAVADVLAGLALAAVGAGFLVASFRIPAASALWHWYDSPRLTPALLSGALLLQAATLLGRGRGRLDPGLRTRIRTGLQKWGAGRVLLALAFCTGFVTLLGRLPFGYLVALVVFGMTLAFRGAGPGRAAVLAAVTAVAVQLVFGRLFFVPLP
jgi:hypothetical protein